MNAIDRGRERAVIREALIPVSRSWDRDEPVIDLETLAGLLRTEGARVLVAWPRCPGRDDRC